MSSPEPAPPTVPVPALASFTRQLGAMLDVGVDVLRGLRIASQHTGNTELMEVASQIARLLEDGREMHQALSRYPELFNPFYVEMTRQGENDGMLGKALLAVADYLDHLSHDTAPVTGPDGASPARPPETPAASTAMGTLGVLALGAGGLWVLAAARPNLTRWLPPLGLFWSGACLLAGATRMKTAPAAGKEALPFPRRLPPKSSERKAAETEAIVRTALDEQAEEEASRPFSPGEDPFAPDDDDPFSDPFNGRPEF